MKEIIQKLIDYYAEHIAVIENSDFTDAEAYQYITCQYLLCGVCFTAYYVFDRDIHCSYFVIRNYLDGTHYWYDEPEDFRTKQENLDCLKYRLNILEKELSLINE